LYFVCTDNWKLNIERVKLRVQGGGHDVDHSKKSRYFGSLKTFNNAAHMADSSFLIDNSNNLTRIAELSGGKVTFIIDPFPNWFRD
jgi:predicted ABC-type ATPase